jgi:hypothetical protein
MLRDERGVTAAFSRAASASQRAALILERNRLGYTHGGDRRSWKFRARAMGRGSGISNISTSPGNCRTKSPRMVAIRSSRNYCDLKKSVQNLPPKRGSDRDAAKVRDAGTPELLGAEKGKISAASLVCPGRPCGSALRFPVGAPPSAPLDIPPKPVGTSGIG